MNVYIGEIIVTRNIIIESDDGEYLPNYTGQYAQFITEVLIHNIKSKPKRFLPLDKGFVDPENWYKINIESDVFPFINLSSKLMEKFLDKVNRFFKAGDNRLIKKFGIKSIKDFDSNFCNTPKAIKI